MSDVAVGSRCVTPGGPVGATEHHRIMSTRTGPPRAQWSMTSFDNAHVIITGGSEGIGLAVAHEASRRGARVSLIARRSEPLATAARRLGPTARWAAADVADRDATAAAVAELTQEQGPCDILMANAGYSRPGRFWELDLDEFSDEMAVNYLGAVHATAAVLPAMRQRRRGHLCFTSSTAGLVGVYGFTAYSPTKFALRGLAESLRCELAPDGIRVSVLYPPDTDTPGLKKEKAGKPPETEAISGTIKPMSADRVAAVTVAGIERNRFTICADPMTRLLAHASGLMAPLTRRIMDRQVRSVQRSGRT